MVSWSAIYHFVYTEDFVIFCPREDAIDVDFGFIYTKSYIMIMKVKKTDCPDSSLQVV